MEYTDWLKHRQQAQEPDSIEPVELHKNLFPFQRDLVEWALYKGRCAIFADCGLGKTLIQLSWADNVARRTNKTVLILAPIAVAAQSIKEGQKFGIECARSIDGDIPTGAKIVITNYERIHYFNPADFGAVVCDESSILKNFNGARRGEITEFLRSVPYRLLCTATASPNDYIELGTSSEALGELGYMDMLGMFFKSDDNTIDPRGGFRRFSQGKWRFKHHAERDFWKWVCSWSRALRMPSDMGYDNKGFVLPKLIERETCIKAITPRDGWLFDLPAVNLHEQREERRRTVAERCEAAASLVNESGDSAVMWCHLNREAETLVDLVSDAEQVQGGDSPEEKESLFMDFAGGNLRVLVTKPKIGGFGLNWQHCNHQTFFPSHSYEQYYQAVRRCWRFGQKRSVAVDVITSDGESGVLRNLKRKSEAATKMFNSLVECMHQAHGITQDNKFLTKQDTPSWL